MNFKNWHKRQAFLGLVAPLFLWIPYGLPLLIAGLSVHLLWLIIGASAQWQASLKTGLTNAVTLFRILLVFTMVMVFNMMDSWWIAIILWCAAILDGVDGYLARKWKTQSSFGALLDEEGDALFMLLTGLILVEGQWMPWWFFLAGWMRYLVLMVRLFTKKKSVEDLKIPGARLIGGWSFGLTPLLFLLPHPFHLVLGLAILLSLIYSFTRELYYHVRNSNDLFHL